MLFISRTNCEFNNCVFYSNSNFNSDLFSSSITRDRRLFLLLLEDCWKQINTLDNVGDSFPPLPKYNDYFAIPKSAIGIKTRNSHLIAHRN